jgi:hypothetical protein
MDIKLLLEELDKLNLPKDQYAIFGSGPLGIRGLVESTDLDLVLTKELFDKLRKQYPVDRDFSIKLGNLELFDRWTEDFNYDANVLIKTADIIQGHRFVKLEYVLEWKKQYYEKRHRDKDKVHIKLIEEYLNKKS